MKLKNIVPKIQLKIKTTDGVEKTITSEKRRKIYLNLMRDDLSEINLKVTYGPGIHNSGTYKRKSEARQALRDWTEKTLIKHLEDGAWDV